MNFSEEYLYENFKRNYDDALTAKAAGNVALAKSKLYQAASYLEKLALTSAGAKKNERLTRAVRIKAIADAIELPVQAQPRGKAERAPQASADDGSGMEQFFTFYSADDLTDGFDSVIGLEQAKAAVTEYVINPIRYPDAYTYNFLENKAVLLEGPPGTGKTTFAKAVAKEINQPFALINVAALVNCYVGETGKNIDKVFAFLRDYAKKNNCGITVFFDELDEIAKRRGGEDKASEASVPALLRNLDGIKKNKNFLILANTNRKDVLDTAIAERFRKQIYIPLPDEATRKKLFEIKLSDVESEYLERLNFEEAVTHSEGLSGRDITFICDDLKYLLSEIKAGLASVDILNERLIEMLDGRQREKKLVKS